MRSMLEEKHFPTKFQKRLMEDGKTILAIVEALYPDLDVDWDVERGNLKVTPHPHYSWLMFRYKEGNVVDFAIDNHEATMNGVPIYGSIATDVYNYLDFSFKVIPFKNKYNKGISETRKKRVGRILKDAGYLKPKFDEFWYHYHKD